MDSEFEQLPKKENEGALYFTEQWFGSMSNFRTYIHLSKTLIFQKKKHLQILQKIPGYLNLDFEIRIKPQAGISS